MHNRMINMDKILMLGMSPSAGRSAVISALRTRSCDTPTSLATRGFLSQVLLDTAIPIENGKAFGPSVPYPTGSKIGTNPVEN